MPVFFSGCREKECLGMNRLFNGRYGFDPFSLFMLIFSFMFFTTHYLWVVGIFLVVYALYRAMSKDFAKRKQELMAFSRYLYAFLGFFQRLFWRIGSFFSVQKRKVTERKTHLYVKCPKCHRILRLPRHKGKLEITCPVCKNNFYKKT